MDVVFHLGAHLTDEGRLVGCLLANRARLRAQGIAIPEPKRYRRELRKLSQDMRNQPITRATEEALLDALLDDDGVQRVVFSWDNFLSQPQWAVSNGHLYHAAGERVAQLRRLFPTSQVTFCLALRNPATLLPALVQADPGGTLAGALREAPLSALRWSMVLARIVQAAPDVAITLWSDEDTPLIWPEVLRAVSGHAPDLQLDGWLRWYSDLVTPKGLAAMHRWFAANPVEDDLHRRRVLSALVARFARPELVTPDIHLPGWDSATLEHLDAAYQEDLDLIAAMPGVTLLEP